MPPINHVIIFGDSLSDIGRKAKTIMGRAAVRMKAMTINMTNRFSDCKNWTDFMFEDASGSSLIKENHSDTIKASAAFHRLKANWVLGPDAKLRFRYANYAMGGAVGGRIKTLLPGLGITSFAEQVKEFKEDYAKLSLTEKAGAKFLFIVMFGSNDIYTDKIKTISAQTPQIANKIMINCMETINIIQPESYATGTKPRRVGNNNTVDTDQQIDYHFMIIGVAKPHQSRRYTEALQIKQWAVSELEEEYEKRRLYDTPKEILAINLMRAKALCKLYETKNEEARICAVANALNIKLKDLVSTVFNGKSTFFCMDQCLSELEAPLAAEMCNFKMNDKQDKLYRKIDVGALNYEQHIQETESTFFFTNDGVHPTSRAYGYLWSKIKDVVERSDKTFGLLAGDQPSISKEYDIIADERMKLLLKAGLAQYQKEISNIFASASKPSLAAAYWLGKPNFTFKISQGKDTSGRVWPTVEVPVFVAVMYLLVVNNAHEAPPRPDGAPERLNSQTTRLGKILRAQVLKFGETKEGSLYKEFIL